MDKNFTSRDISLVAYLFTKGHEITSTTSPDNFNRVSFTFEENDKLLKDLYGYQTNQSIPVQDYYRGLSHIWNLIKQKNNRREVV